MDLKTIGTGVEIILGAYGLFPGSISPENFTAVPSMNSVMGLVNDTDFTVAMEKDSNGTLWAVGLAPGNRCRVGQIIEACNGYLYVLDEGVRPSTLATELPSRLGFGAQLVEIYTKDGICPFPLPQAVEYGLENSSDWVRAWNQTGLTPSLLDAKVSTTLLIPVNGSNGTSSNANDADIATQLYNMLPGEWCPNELADRGEVNSMLGEVLGTYLPLYFSNDTNNNLVVSNGADGVAHLVAKNSSCHYVELGTDGVLTLSDVEKTKALAALQAMNSSSGNLTLPHVPIRHITCNPPVFAAIAVPWLLQSPPPNSNGGGGALNSSSNGNSSGANTGSSAFSQQQQQDGGLSPPTSTSSSSSSSSSSTGMVVGVVVGVGCAVILGALAGVFIVRRRRRARGSGGSLVDGKDTICGDGSGESSSTLSPTTSKDGGGGKIGHLSAKPQRISPTTNTNTVVDSATSTLALLHPLHSGGTTSDTNTNNTGGSNENTNTPTGTSGSRGRSSSGALPKVAVTPSHAIQKNKQLVLVSASSVVDALSAASQEGRSLRSMSDEERLTLEMPAGSSSGGGGGGGLGSGSGASHQLARLGALDDLDLWELHPSDVEIAVDSEGHPAELGRGSFGAVYKGAVRGVQAAAIKVLDCSLDMEGILREAAILRHVSRDRNVVQLYGTSRMPGGELLLVMELMEGGDLRHALNDPRVAAELVWSKHGRGVALDIARGLTALHAVHVVHRDLKSKNVLLSRNYTAKIGDVGIAAVHSQGYLTASAGRVVGTLAWSAPELLMGQRCTEKVDIYSLGIVLWEIATGEVPQRGFTEIPPLSADRCPLELAQLISDCTDEDPKKRPTAKEVCERILKMQSDDAK